MYNPTTRLLTILELLQARGEISGSDIAERLEVEPRSVRRYITMLRDMGIPVEAERGRYGSYHLRPGYRLPPLMFNDEEILAVVLGLMMARKAAVVTSSGSESASAKIERVLPLELRQRVRALQDTLTINLTEQEYANPAESEVVAAVTLAAHEQKGLAIRYESSRLETTERVIDPYGVMFHTGTWYTVGYCHLRKGMRVFRLDRIRSTRATQQLFDRPDDFNVADYILDSIARMPDGLLIEVILHTSIERARRVIPADMAVLEAHEDGVMMRCYASNMDWMARYMLRFSFGFRIVQPEALRDHVRMLAKRFLKLAEA